MACESALECESDWNEADRRWIISYAFVTGAALSETERIVALETLR